MTIATSEGETPQLVSHGDVVGKLDRGGQKFVQKHWPEILSGIKQHYYV